MIKFFEIPKNAHTTLNSLLLSARTINGDIEVVCLRKPLERFWDACKTVTPELSPFGDFPWTPESVRNAPTTYEGLSLTPGEVIETVKERLVNNNLTEHLKSQVEIIQNKRFDHVIKVENLDSDLLELCEIYGIELPPVPRLIASVKEWDSEAMEIINTDSYLQEYYSEDIELYNNPTELLK